MAKYSKQDSQVKLDLTPTSGELDKLRAAMEGKRQERMNGRLQPRFLQVMYDWKVLTLMDDGRPMVRDPYAYTKWNDANEMVEAADRNAEDSFFQAHPEEREKAEERRRAWMEETRTYFTGVAKAKRI